MLPATSDRKVLRLNMAHSFHQLINVTDTAEKSWRNDRIPGSKSVRGILRLPAALRQRESIAPAAVASEPEIS
jgi:hypothetical protein